VQLVERPQIAMAGLLGINSSGSERIVNPLYYRPISVVALDHCFDVGHPRLPLIVNCISYAALRKLMRGRLAEGGSPARPWDPFLAHLGAARTSRLTRKVT
jgi:hypothetical protein